jgi:hypothetical protein
MRRDAQVPEMPSNKLIDLLADLDRTQKYLMDETAEPGAWRMSEDLREWEAYLRSILNHS